MEAPMFRTAAAAVGLGPGRGLPPMVSMSTTATCVGPEVEEATAMHRIVAASEGVTAAEPEVEPAAPTQDGARSMPPPACARRRRGRGRCHRDQPDPWSKPPTSRSGGPGVEGADTSIGDGGGLGNDLRPSRDPSAGILRLDGEYWTVAYGGRELRLRDSKGMRRLAQLLRAPGREFHALDLVGFPRSVAGDAGRYLDPAAKNAYRRRLADLEADREEAEADCDLARAAQVQAERDFLVAELAAALGLGGRDRVAAATAERARQSVSRAVRGVIKRIEVAHSALGEHLNATVSTGLYCAYRPDPRVPIVWAS